MSEIVRARDIVRLYRDAETYLLQLIAQATRREARGTADFYSRQYRELQRVLMLAQRRVTALENASSVAVEQAILDAYNTQITQKHISDELLPAFVNDAAVSTLVQTVKHDLHTHHVQVMRDVDDAYRRITNEVTASKLVAGETHTQALQRALNRFADRGITGFVDKSGRRWRIDSYADMAVRTVTNHAAFQGRMRDYIERGVDIVRISTHHNCSNLCQPFQGRLLALTGEAGERIVRGADGSRHFVTVTATMQDALGRGYKHPNCRHTETRFIAGAPAPPQVPYDKREYEAEQHQRYLERGIRRWKRREAAAITSEEQAHARAKIKQWQAEIKQHVDSHEHLSRFYNREQTRAAKP
ncbi:minor capsid protein [Corynebacterium pyruviciproducens]|uniref:phage minor capsid protein n=1 Tax=Corynebacterium pyruviciproducens TaxID=598660 RepID=UPI002551BF6D|nr:phage minor capsid protein [Corynebacterium pyruviciproducens]MDK6565893.1 minor capsid protein [Corynebacterium pyruviciproducens]